jgi:hypothetical protein
MCHAMAGRILEPFPGNAGQPPGPRRGFEKECTMHPHPYTVGLLQDQRNAELHRQAAEARLIRAAADAGPTASVQPVGRRLRVFAGQLLVSLVSVSFASGANKPAGA